MAALLLVAALLMLGIALVSGQAHTCGAYDDHGNCILWTDGHNWYDVTGDIVATSTPTPAPTATPTL